MSRIFTTQASQEAYDLARDILSAIAGEHGAQSTCIHCQRPIQMVDGEGWVDPEATGDDDVWRDTCDAHDTRTAEHESAREDLADALADEIASLVGAAMDAYGDERFECGQEAGETSGYERGDSDAREELELAWYGPGDQMAQAWQHRFREAGWQDVRTHNAERADEISLTVREIDAWEMVRRLAN